MNTKELQQEKQEVDEEIKQIVDYEEGIFGKWKDILNKANEIFGSTTNTGSLHYLLEAKSQALSKGISALQEQQKQVMKVIKSMEEKFYPEVYEELKQKLSEVWR
jgi:phage tail tape-measure protein